MSDLYHSYQVMESKIKELQCVLEHQQDLILNLLQEEEENQLIIQSYEDKIKQLMNGIKMWKILRLRI